MFFLTTWYVTPYNGVRHTSLFSYLDIVLSLVITLTFGYGRGCALGRSRWTASALDAVHPEGKGKKKLVVSTIGLQIILQVLSLPGVTARLSSAECRCTEPSLASLVSGMTPQCASSTPKTSQISISYRSHGIPKVGMHAEP